MPRQLPGQDDDAEAGRRPRGRDHSLHAEEWTEAAGRSLRALVSGTARPGRPEVLLVPGLGSVGYLVELLQACVSAFEPPGQLRCTLPDCLRGGRRFREYLRSALADRPEDDIRRIDAPVLVARGRHDHFASQRWVEELADAAPRGRARTLPGAHAVPYNHPRAVALLAGEAAAGLGG